MNSEELIQHLLKKPGYLKAGVNTIAKQFNLDPEKAKEIRAEANAIYYSDEYYGEEAENPLTPKESIRTNNILVIGDLHEPFTRTGYLEFCADIYDKYSCNGVVFIGDIIDNHFSSFHDTDPDGHSAALELEKARRKIQTWHRIFPKAFVCLGNHDLLIARKAFNSGLSSQWIKSIGEVLDTPTWTFQESFLIDGVEYTHGVGRKAHKRMLYDGISVVQGHYHSESSIQYLVGAANRLFAMQVGCGVDDKSYAMAYGKHFNKMHINCGVVLENGTLPIIEYMKL